MSRRSRSVPARLLFSLLLIPIPPVGEGLLDQASEILGTIAPGAGGAADQPKVPEQPKVPDQPKAPDPKPQPGPVPEARKPLPFTFVRDGYRAHALEAGHRPYNSGRVLPKSDPGVHDRYGVRMAEVDGKLYNHPVGQAQYGLDNLESYRITKDGFFLQRAKKQAQRLIDTRVVSRKAWYFPYRFGFDLHGRASLPMHPPWYSAMAQGQAMSLFVRLHNATGYAKWRTAANLTFGSFLNRPDKSRPWVVHKDGANHLWLEEYAAWPTKESDKTFNGHMFAIYGLWDYYRLTRDSRALALYDGGLSTVRRYVLNGFRVARGTSYYCLTHKVASPKYHQTHIKQLLQLHGMTQEVLFARYADIYRDDDPNQYDVGSGVVEFQPGYVQAFKIDASHRVTYQKQVLISRRTAANADARQRISGRGINYHIKNGSLAGFWVKEAHDKTAARGPVAQLIYHPHRVATFKSGQRYVGYQFDRAGKVTSTKSQRFPRETKAPFDRSGWINGQRHVRISAGSYTGYWVVSASLTLS